MDMNNLFVQNRLKYHTASRIPIQTGQSLSQATNPDGHIVTDAQVWTAKTDEFPVNRDTNKTTSDGTAASIDLVQVFVKGLPEKRGFYKVTWENGEKKRTPIEILGSETDDELILKLDANCAYESEAYPAARLFYKAEMTAVNNSNAQSYEHIMYDGGPRVMNWVAPTAVKDNGIPVPGFSGYGEAVLNDGKEKMMESIDGWGSLDGNWEFVYISGMLIIDPGHLLASKQVSKICYTGFQYIGSTLDQSLGAIQTSTEQNMLACRMFPFEYSEMTGDDNGPKTIVIPAIVFNVFNTKTGMAYGDLTYNTDGSTTITFEKESIAIDGTMIGDGDGFVALGFTKGDNSQMSIIKPSTWDKGQGIFPKKS